MHPEWLNSKNRKKWDKVHKKHQMENLKKQGAKHFLLVDSLENFSGNAQWSDEEKDLYNQIVEAVNAAMSPCMERMVADYMKKEFPDGVDIPEDFVLPEKIRKEMAVKKIAIVSSIFSPALKDEDLGIVQQLPSNYQIATDRIVNLMSVPQDHFKTEGFYRRANRRLASDMVRAALIQSMENDIEHLVLWGEVFHGEESAPALQELAPQMQNHFGNVKRELVKRIEMSSSLSREGAKVNRASRIGKISLNVGLTAGMVSLSAGIHAAVTASGVAVAGAAVIGVTTAASLMLVTGGFAAIGIAAVAGIAFCYYASKKKKKFELAKKLSDQSHLKCTNDFSHVERVMGDAFTKMALDTELPGRNKKVVDPDVLLEKREKSEFGIDADDFVDRLMSAIMRPGTMAQ